MGLKRQWRKFKRNVTRPLKRVANEYYSEIADVGRSIVDPVADVLAEQANKFMRFSLNIESDPFVVDVADFIPNPLGVKVDLDLPALKRGGSVATAQDVTGGLLARLSVDDTVLETVNERIDYLANILVDGPRASREDAYYVVLSASPSNRDEASVSTVKADIHCQPARGNDGAPEYVGALALRFDEDDVVSLAELASKAQSVHLGGQLQSIRSDEYLVATESVSFAPPDDKTLVVVDLDVSSFRNIAGLTIAIERRNSSVVERLAEHVVSNHQFVKLSQPDKHNLRTMFLLDLLPASTDDRRKGSKLRAVAKEMKDYINHENKRGNNNLSDGNPSMHDTSMLAEKGNVESYIVSRAKNRDKRYAKVRKWQRDLRDLTESLTINDYRLRYVLEIESLANTETELKVVISRQDEGDEELTLVLFPRSTWLQFLSPQLGKGKIIARVTGDTFGPSHSEVITVSILSGFETDFRAVISKTLERPNQGKPASAVVDIEVGESA